MQPHPSIALLKPKEVAQRLNISLRSLRRLVASGQLPKPIRFSARASRFRENDIDKYIQSRAG